MAADAKKLDAQGARLRTLKKLARVTFRQIAENVHVTERQAQRWFAGESEIGSENLKRLAEYLGTSANYIEYGNERDERGQTPDLAQQSQLDRIEGMLQALLARVPASEPLEPQAIEEVMATMEQLMVRLGQNVSERDVRSRTSKGRSRKLPPAAA